MDLGIRGKVALVTGAARSLGKADALALAAEGCKVAIVDLNREGAEETAKEIREAGRTARGHECDIRDDAARESRARGRTARGEECAIRDAAAVGRVTAAIESDLGPVDICVNNAGF